MAELTPYLIVAWVLAAVALFPSVTPRRAVLAVILVGTLFLPEVGGGEVALGPIHFTKYLAVSYAALFGVLLFDAERLFAFVPRWYDLPMLVWCLCPLPSVLTNDPPPDGSSALRDAVAQTLAQAVPWGVPYLLGRVYFSDPAGVRELAAGLVLAALVYAPLCLYEVRMSPHLHADVYGFRQHSFGQTVRLGGYRPMVFLPHGLALSLFLVAAALLSVWGRAARTPADPPAGWLGYAPLLLVPTAVLSRSTGALALGAAGGLALLLLRAAGSRAGLLVLLALPPAYVTARATGVWTGEELVELAGDAVEADRAKSLQFRLTNENQLVRKALDRPAFGWGGWGRNRVYDATGRDVSVTDGLWVVALGDRGLVGLVALGGAVLLPGYRWARTRHPGRSAADGLAVVLTLWAIDSLFNGMYLPVYPLIAGALAGLPDALRPAASEPHP